MTHLTDILMKEDMTMITIQIDEYINGFSVVGYDSHTRKKFIDEIHEEKVNALKSVYWWINSELEDELQRRQSNASTM